MNAKQSAADKFTRRLYMLNVCVVIVILGAIIVSISQFGIEAWEGRPQIGFVLPDGRDKPGWNRTQYRAMQAACDGLGYDLLLRENVFGTAKETRTVVQELANRGVAAIVLANACPLAELGDIPQKYPRIRFYAVQNPYDSPFFAQYNVRYIEPRYLAGIMAGMRTKTNRIGYIAPFIAPDTAQGINAFALGVQRVKPEAQVLLVWTGSWNDQMREEQAVLRLQAEKADILAYHQDDGTIPNMAERVGIDFISTHEPYPAYNHYLGTITTDWQSLYMDILRIYNAEINPSPDAFQSNHWLGMFERVTDVAPATSRMSARSRAVFETARWELLHGRLVFSGEIYDRNDKLRSAANESISNQYLWQQMDWLVKGVNVVGN